jgi:hypothetical protein
LAIGDPAGRYDRHRHLVGETRQQGEQPDRLALRRGGIERATVSAILLTPGVSPVEIGTAFLIPPRPTRWLSWSPRYDADRLEAFFITGVDGIGEDSDR